MKNFVYEAWILLEYMKAMDFFTEQELKKLKPDTLPTKHQVLLYVYTRTNSSQRHDQGSHVSAVNELATKVIEIWEKADCCPYTRRHVTSLFDKHVWQQYQKLLREKTLPGEVSTKKRSHKATKRKKKVTPTRKSSRLNVSELCTRGTTADELENSEESDESEPTRVETRSSGGVSLRQIWDLHEGYKTFDIKSDQRVNLKTTKCFDKSFYEDQVEPSKRKLRMLWTKVTEEFKKEEQMRKKREAIQERNRKSAIASQNRGAEEIQMDDDESGCEDSDDQSDVDCVASSSSTVRTSYSTRNSSNLVPSAVESKDKPVRILNKSGKKMLVEPRYLEALSLMMAENLSASEAIRAGYIWDTIVWQQKRHLPLRLDKSYMKARKKLKRLQPQNFSEKSGVVRQKQPNFQTTKSMETEILQECANVEDESIEALHVTVNDENLSDEARKLKKLVDEGVRVRKEDHAYTLPDVSCVRHNHNLMAVYCEGRVAEQLVSKKGFILPDGTSRQGVGEVAAAVVKVGEKFRALKTVKITKGTTSNWADAVSFML